MIWHTKKADEVIEALGSDALAGLDDDKIEAAREKFGYNRMTAKEKKTLLGRLLEQFKDFMVIILLIAAAISCVATVLSGENDWLEPIIIVLIVVLNASLGVYQESRAEAALEALKGLSAPVAKVLRGGTQLLIKSEELVPGDIIILEAGDFVPADARLIQSMSLKCDESALTGESVPAEKDAAGVFSENTGVGDRHNMIYSGCTVVYGRAKAVVTATAMETQMGKIAAMLDSTQDSQTPLQIKLSQLGKTLGIIALGICAVIFVVGIAFPTAQDAALPFDERLLKMFMTSVSLAVAAVPEGLPAIVTIVLSIGVQRMVRKNAIIRRLPAVETLGSASVICSDKTGTLTQNRMTLTRVYDGATVSELSAGADIPKSVQKVLNFAALCCDAQVTIENGEEIHKGDPTETGIVAAAIKYAGFNLDHADKKTPRKGEIPFDSDRKLMTTVNEIDGKLYAIVKGAPDILISRCVSFDSEKALNANLSMGRDALRVLGVAYKEIAPGQNLDSLSPQDTEKDLTFLGLVGMIDPPRPEAQEAIRVCSDAGIRTVMITGDHITTAIAIARQLGILHDDGQALLGGDLQKLSDKELFENIEHYTVYARVSPEDKIRIVKLWQKKGHVVAMTGDGVNDAPALKAADIGCAMGITGTDVAKSAAAMTLTDDNFSTIVTAVEEGRGIYDNIKKAVAFLLSCNLGEIITVLVAILLGWGTPLSPIMLLWVNLVTDGLPALALGMEPVESDTMSRKPRKKDESIFAGGLGINVLWQGTMVGLITLAAFYIGMTQGGHLYGMTMAFAALALSQLVHAMNIRSSHSLFSVGFASNKFMVGAFAASLSLMLIVLLTPVRSVFGLEIIAAQHWIWIALLAIAPLIIVEVVKLLQNMISCKRRRNAA